MKKLFIMALVVFVLYTAFSRLNAHSEPSNNSKGESGSFNLTAQNAVLIDEETGEILYEKKSYTKCYPASTTKLLTALVALDYAHADEIITVGDEANLAAPDSSKAGIRYGEQLSLEQLLNSLLIPSGNDAAYTIAAYIGRKASGGKALSERDAVDHFCNLMTAKAKKLGARDSNFTNPDGYQDEAHYTTSYDMALIAKEAMTHAEIRNIVIQTGYRLPDIKANEFRKRECHASPLLSEYQQADSAR